jgi:hypothetical protein
MGTASLWEGNRVSYKSQIGLGREKRLARCLSLTFRLNGTIHLRVVPEPTDAVSAPELTVGWPVRYLTCRLKVLSSWLLSVYHCLLDNSSKYNGNAMADIIEISDRLKPEKIDHACVLATELVKDTSDSYSAVLWYTLDVPRST